MVPDLTEDPRFRSAVRLFNDAEWYQAHDAFEEIWHEKDGSQRSFLQGIIQISVAEYHLANDNLRGALLLMAEGLKHLEESSCVYFDTAKCHQVARKRLAALQRGQTPAGLPFPILFSPEK